MCIAGFPTAPIHGNVFYEQKYNGPLYNEGTKYANWL